MEIFSAIFSQMKGATLWPYQQSIYILTVFIKIFWMLIFIYFYIIIIIFSFIFISWRLITLQYCSGFCHTLTWISHGFTCILHPDPPSRLPLHPIPLGIPSAPGPSTCLMHPTWAGDLFHPRWYTCFDAVLSKHPTLPESKSLFYTSVSLFLFCI